MGLFLACLTNKPANNFVVVFFFFSLNQPLTTVCFLLLKVAYTEVLLFTEDRETRLRNLREKQNVERQKKLDEIKAQALAAKRFRDQKVQERQQRMEETRLNYEQRRQQVEQRKKAINDAERGRLESILKRNMEREARIEAKKRNERSSMIFAFGSSTPRNLDPTDSSTSFWGHRRATSTQNISSTTTTLTRQQSERDLDGGSKKRAESVNGLERAAEG